MGAIPFDQRDGFIWMDGKMLPWREANVHFLTHGLHYGSCVFEGIRAYNGKPFKMTEHNARLHRSAEILGMKISQSVAELDQICMDVLAASIAQAADMLRTRVDVNLEAQNSKLLRAMESRSRTQLRIQEAVEGLSVFAISYYLIGLLKVLAEGLLPASLENREHVAAAIAVPVVLVAVWLGVRRLRRVLKSDHDPDS